jgi:translation initiation factor IF-2
MMENAAEAASVVHRRSGSESDWGVPKLDAISPEERHALRRRQNALDQRRPERETRSAGRERDSDRDMQRRSRGRDVDRFEDRPKRRQNHRARGFGRDLDDDEDSGFDYEEYQARKRAAQRRKEEKRAAKEAEAPKKILLPEYITVLDLSQALGVKPQQFLDDLGELGFENILHDSIMTGETAALVAAEYGLDPVLDTGDDIDLKPQPPPEDPSTLPPRPPIVTIMGHVDHGKTTMLDWLRKSSVAAQEHGGITQHIGAFSVRLSSGKLITFLDTPGHAAFLSMRQRGANVTDIVVLVVAVDDSVKPQTLEAIKHAQNAQVPIIVAINKIDMDESRIGQVKQDLAANGVEIEDFGGDVQVVGVSGKTGKGMDDLEESILTLSEILDVRAETDGMAEGWVLEASVKVDGKAATVLVRRGTIRVGDLIVAGTTYAKVRMMRNEAGVEVKEAGPGTPVEVLGWRDSPVAGDLVLQAGDEDRAQAAVDYREELAARARAAAQKGQEELKNREKAEQEALEKMMAEEGEDAAAAEAEDSGPKTVNTIVRGDVMGSVEAVCTAVLEIGNNEVQARVLRSSPGLINESDIELMAVAKGCIINFNNPIPGYIKAMAEEKGVRILDHTIIYHLVEDVKGMMSEQLAPIISQKVLAEAEVLQVFSINIVKRIYKNIAGVRVKSGTLTRGGMYRVMRNGEKLFEGQITPPPPSFSLFALWIAHHDA